MTIVYILAAVLIFSFLIAIHELGHFMTAKLCGVRVNGVKRISHLQVPL